MYSSLPEFKQEETRKEALKILQSHGIEGLVIIGGDGPLNSLVIKRFFWYPIVGLPGTIDNNVGALIILSVLILHNTILDAINKLRDTASVII